MDVTRSGMVVVPVQVNGAGPVRFLVDTGATTTTLDAGFATTLGLRAAGSLRIVTASGSVTAPAGKIATLGVGGLDVRDLAVSWMPLDALRVEDERIMGVIGQDVLADLTVTIDYARRRVRFGSERCASGDMTMAVERSDRRPTVAARLRTPAGNREVRLVVDSGVNAMVLFERSAGSGNGVRLATHTGSADAAFVSVATATLAGLAVSGPAVALQPAEPRGEDGLLPASWFSRVCIDGPRAAAVLTR